MATTVVWSLTTYTYTALSNPFFHSTHHLLVESTKRVSIPLWMLAMTNGLEDFAQRILTVLLGITDLRNPVMITSK